MCHFDGAPPEMTKTRKVIVLSPRIRDYTPSTYLVMPVSKTMRSSSDGFHVEFKPRSYSFFDPVESVWALADMITCVSGDRLDRIKINGQYSRAQLRTDDLQRVRMIAAKSLGLETLLHQDIIEKISIKTESITVTVAKAGPS